MISRSLGDSELVTEPVTKDYNGRHSLPVGSNKAS